jgi:hypothetical protein
MHLYVGIFNRPIIRTAHEVGECIEINSRLLVPRGETGPEAREPEVLLFSRI